MARSETGVEHLLRRAGFGASQDDLKAFENTSTSGVLDYVIDYERQADDVDSKIGDPAYASITAVGGFVACLPVIFSPLMTMGDLPAKWDDGKVPEGEPEPAAQG
mgnify:CR=1 FL=1